MNTKHNLNDLLNFNNNTYHENISVYFRHLKEELIKQIRQFDMIIGAVAWITDLDILDELSKKKTLLVIQKEDFLRPDLETRLSKTAKEQLHEAYSKFKPFDGRTVGEGPFFQSIDDTYANLEPILCFGNFEQGQMYRVPRLHNKFLVFLEKENNLYYSSSVWTGSMNLTQLSVHSLENAILIKDHSIATAYTEEAQLIYLQGEKLNWTTEWINPFYRD